MIINYNIKEDVMRGERNVIYNNIVGNSIIRGISIVVSRFERVERGNEAEHGHMTVIMMVGGTREWERDHDCRVMLACCNGAPFITSKLGMIAWCMRFRGGSPDKSCG